MVKTTPVTAWNRINCETTFSRCFRSSATRTSQVEEVHFNTEIKQAVFLDNLLIMTSADFILLSVKCDFTLNVWVAKCYLHIFIWFQFKYLHSTVLLVTRITHLQSQSPADVSSEAPQQEWHDADTKTTGWHQEYLHQVSSLLEVLTNHQICCVPGQPHSNTFQLIN